MKFISWTISLFFLILVFDLSAQIERNQTLDQNPDFVDSLDILEVDTNYLVPDTTILNYFSIDYVQHKTPFIDTGIHTPFSQVDFTRTEAVDHLTLGNSGSAYYPIFQTVSDVRGFDNGLHQYDIYKRQKEEFIFFDVNRPYTNLFFSPGSSQQNFLVKAQFARRFAKGITAVIDYYRINQEGIYTSQKTRHTMFSFGIWYKSKSNRFNSFFTYISNANNEENNGGVSNDQLFDDPNYSIRQSIPVTLTNASTRHETRTFTFNNILRLNNPQQANEYSLRYEFSYQDGKYKFYDEGTSSSSDADFYGSYLIDERGLRYFLTNDKLENSFYIYSNWKKLGNVRLGLQHSFHQLNLEATKENVNNLFATFRSRLNIGKAINLDIEAFLGLGDNVGDFQLKGNASLNSKIGKVEFGTNFKRKKASLIETQLYINEQIIYENEFTRPIYLDVYGKWKLNSTSVHVSQLTVTNPIFFDEEVLPQQFDGTYSNTRIQLSQKLKFGILHFDNHLFYQVFSDNIYNLPEYFTKHDLYLSSYLFKRKMLFKMGFDARLLSQNIGPGYFPLTGQFYSQKENTFDFYPEVDYYFSFKVDTFRAFFRLNNVSDYFIKGAPFQINTYPLFDSNFRFGINWIMKD